MGDVTYGACCVDDLSADELGSDFIIHYGFYLLFIFSIFQVIVAWFLLTKLALKPCTCLLKSPLILIISFLLSNSISQIKAKGIFSPCLKLSKKKTSLIIMGTIQFNTALFTAKKALEEV
jgi:2-(3-amino-3-carboxypropyl)histidine synthase